MRLLVLLILTCSALHADVLADLKTTLASLNTHEPVNARVGYTFSSHNGEDDKPVVEEATITAQVADGPEGLTILWPRELIDRTAVEPRKQNDEPNNEPATQKAMDGVNAMLLNDYLNATTRLQRLLGESELLSEKTEAWEGQPARCLTFKVIQKLPKYVKELQCTVKLWLAADGIPLAAERRLFVKGRALLVIGFESTESEDWRFARIGQRLVVMRHVRESQGSGGGEKGGRKTVASLTFNDR